MRRKDRQVTDNAAIDRIILSCSCCRLGFRDGEGVYIVPLNFGFALEDGKRLLYFHGAGEGKKIELIRSQTRAGFEMDTGHRLNEAETACGYSFGYRSIIGQGHVSFVEDPLEKRRALGLIMEHYSSKKDWRFPQEAVRQVAVIKLVVTELACKEHA